MTFEEGLDKLECIRDHEQDEELIKELKCLTERAKHSKGYRATIFSSLSLKEFQAVWEGRTKTS